VLSWDRVKRGEPLISIRQLNANMAFLTALTRGLNADGMIGGPAGLLLRRPHELQPERRFEIVTNEGDGEYTVKPQQWSVTDSDWVDAPESNTETAYEMAGDDSGAVGDVVYGRRVDALDAESVILLEIAERRGVEFGKPVSAFTSGTTIILNPVDADGTDNGKDNVNVYLAHHRGTVELPLSTNKIITFMRFREPYDDDGTDPDIDGVIVGLLAGEESVASLLPATYEGSETAQTDSWDRASQGANAGVSIKMTTRVVYNDSGDEKLYGFYRTFTYDSAGMLAAISAETRYTIDEPVACP